MMVVGVDEVVGWVERMRPLGAEWWCSFSAIGQRRGACRARGNRKRSDCVGRGGDADGAGAGSIYHTGQGDAGVACACVMCWGSVGIVCGG